jgi:hypothetical protein
MTPTCGGKSRISISRCRIWRWKPGCNGRDVRHSSRLLEHADKTSEAVAREILDYFLRNPEAADSLTGIARWRLMEEAVRHSVARTEAALQWLLKQGYLRQVPQVGAEGIFQLNPEKRHEAELFLEQKQP